MAVNLRKKYIGNKEVSKKNKAPFFSSNHYWPYSLHNNNYSKMIWWLVQIPWL